MKPVPVKQLMDSMDLMEGVEHNIDFVLSPTKKFNEPVVTDVRGGDRLVFRNTDTNLDATLTVTPLSALDRASTTIGIARATQTACTIASDFKGILKVALGDGLRTVGKSSGGEPTIIEINIHG